MIARDKMLIKGGRYKDDRGVLIYNNDFDMSDVKRSYIVEHDRSFIRAFHGHLHERKWVQVLEGKFKIVTYKLEPTKVEKETFWHPELDTQNIHYMENDGSVLAIPAGYTNGFQNLTISGKIQFFSDKTVKESEGDDIRCRWNYFSERIWDLRKYR